MLKNYIKNIVEARFEEYKKDIEIKIDHVGAGLDTYLRGYTEQHEIRHQAFIDRQDEAQEEFRSDMRDHSRQIEKGLDAMVSLIQALVERDEKRNGV